MIKGKFTVDLSVDSDGKFLYQKDNSVFTSATFQVRWEDVEGTKNGVFKLFGTLDPASDNYSVIGSVTVNSADNIADIYTLIVEAQFTAFMYDYTANDISAGTATINYALRG